MPEQDEAYLEWLAAAPKGVRWDKAQEMWEEYQRKCREQADRIAKRLLGEQELAPCNNPHHGWGSHPRFADCEDWQGGGYGN